MTALVAANQPVRAAAFCRAYNLRANGAAVTPHGVRKWLRGEAVPTQEKILILAKGLNVYSSWLRFGTADGEQSEVAIAMGQSLSTENLALIRDVAILSPAAQTIIREIVDSFLRARAGELASREQGARKDGRKQTLTLRGGSARSRNSWQHSALRDTQFE